MVSYSTRISEVVFFLAWVLGPLLIVLSPRVGFLLSVLLSFFSYSLKGRAIFVSLLICTVLYSAVVLIHLSGVYKNYSNAIHLLFSLLAAHEIR